jgi:hypothetical protein
LEARGELPRPRSSRSYASIVRANTLNVPNGILFFFGVLTITFGSWKDALFVGILISNIAIGSFQEIRSKRALDREGFQNVGSCCGAVVFVDESAESVAALDLSANRLRVRVCRVGREQGEPAVRALAVVVGGVDA